MPAPHARPAGHPDRARCVWGSALLKICAAPGCEEFADAGGARCARHQKEQDVRRAAQKAAAQATPHAAAARALYADPRWKSAARAFLARHPLCGDCGELGVIEPATDVDHIVPHKGDRRRFWDRSNWQPLCHRCHSRKTAREVWHADRG
ncbi:HNH endonuclease signature motif containing protein [Chachezhania sediminis]|uniref:HNH endonuclease signature motif containing protein n=1 Tax=Chachezhania sediminis TaxID=2599291 RepID=UPI00131B7F65|nr:HNH endonuclease signature motif containing protein [Chachezhania sediminis]